MCMWLCPLPSSRFNCNLYQCVHTHTHARAHTQIPNLRTIRQTVQHVHRFRLHERTCFLRKPIRVSYFNFISASLPLHSSIVRSTSVAFFHRTLPLHSALYGHFHCTLPLYGLHTIIAHACAHSFCSCWCWISWQRYSLAYSLLLITGLYSGRVQRKCAMEECNGSGTYNGRVQWK